MAKSWGDRAGSLTERIAASGGIRKGTAGDRAGRFLWIMALVALILFFGLGLLKVESGLRWTHGVGSPISEEW